MLKNCRTLRTLGARGVQARESAYDNFETSKYVVEGLRVAGKRVRNFFPTSITHRVSASLLSSCALGIVGGEFRALTPISLCRHWRNFARCPTNEAGNAELRPADLLELSASAPSTDIGVGSPRWSPSESESFAWSLKVIFRCEFYLAAAGKRCIQVSFDPICPAQ